MVVVEQQRQNRFERTNSTNVAVNGVSMPVSDGRLHRHGPLLKDNDPTSAGGHRQHNSCSRSKSKSRSKSRPRQHARSGAGTLDAFMQQKLEQKNVRLKKVGAALLLMRDEEIDGLTNVAVSEEEPSENDQSKANLKKYAKTQQRRSDRLEKAVHQVHHHHKVFEALEKLDEVPAATASRLSTAGQSPSERRIDDALRLFEKKYKLKAPDQDGASYDAQASAASSEDPSSLKAREKEKLTRSESRPSSGRTDDLSVKVLRVETKHPPTGRSCTAAKDSLAKSDEPAPSASLLPTKNPSPGEDMRKDGSVVAELLSDNVTALLNTVGDDQRSNASTTVRRLERKGRRYKEVITVVSKSDESQPNLLTTGRDTKELKSQPPKHSIATGNLDRTQGRLAVTSCAAQRSSLQVSTMSKHLQESTTVQVEEAQESCRSAPVKAKTNNGGKSTTLGGNVSGGQKSMSPVFKAFQSGYQVTPKSARATWIGLGKIVSPKWFKRRAPENLATPEKPVSGKVTPLIAITYPAGAPVRSGQEKSSDWQKSNSRTETELPNATVVHTGYQESDATRKDFSKNDDDASSLFNFQSPNSSEKELGDIFSFISSRKGSHEANAARKNVSHQSARQESFQLVPIPHPPDSSMTIVNPSDRKAIATVADTRAMLSMDITQTMHQKRITDAKNLPAERKPTGLRVFTARTRGERFMSFLSARHRKEKKEKVKTPVFMRKKNAISAEDMPDGPAAKQTSVTVRQTLPKRGTNPVDECEQRQTDDEAIQGETAAPLPVLSSLPSVVEPASPAVALSRDLTQSTSGDSHATGGVFGFGNLFVGMCGRSKKCEADQPFPWRDCGQEDDDHSLMENSTEDVDEEISQSATELNVDPTCHDPREMKENSLSLPTLDSVASIKNQEATKPPRTPGTLQPLDNSKESPQTQNAEGIDSIETVLHNTRNLESEARTSPMRRMSSLGNFTVTNGTVFNIRVSLRYLKGLCVSFNKTTPSSSVNRSLVVGFVRVSSGATLATQSIDVTRSRPVNLLALEDRMGPLPPVAWSSKRVLDRRRGRLYFSVVLKQLVSGDGSCCYFPERIRFVVGLQSGEEIIELGTASFEVDGTEVSQKRVDLPLNGSVGERKASLLSSLRRSSHPNSFRGDKLVFSLHPMSVLSTKIDVKAGDYDMAGPLVWEDYIVGDDDSFDESLVPSVCEERSSGDHYDSVEVVPLSRGAAIITKNSLLDGNVSHRGKPSPTNEIVSSLRHEGQRGTCDDAQQRHIIPKLFSRRKANVTALSSKVECRRAEDTKCHFEPADSTEDEKGRVEPVENVIVRPEEESLRSPTSDSHSEFSASAFPSNDEESSAGESSSNASRKRVSLTDKAADWVYRGARAAGFFSYSSDDEKMTQFSFSTKHGETYMRPTSDLSESVMTDDASEVVIGQLKYWIQPETSISNAEETDGVPMAGNAKCERRINQKETARRSVGGQDHNQSLDHFKKLLLLAQRLNMSPRDLIRRLEQGENIEDLLRPE